MIDWSTVFDEAYPERGASVEELERLVADVGKPLPASYLSLLAWSNGGEFRNGKRRFQFFPALDPLHGVLAMSEGYEVAQYMRGALPIAFNGGGTFYLFDTRKEPTDGEYPVVSSPASILNWDADESPLVATTFEAACRGRIDIDHLWVPPNQRTLQCIGK